MGIKELQQGLLGDVKDEGKLTSEQAEWLMKQYLTDQAAVEKLYDDEISRQRMILEEKLARRRALAQKTVSFKFEIQCILKSSDFSNLNFNLT